MLSRGYEIARRTAPAAVCGELRRTAIVAAREQQRDGASWLAMLRRLAGATPAARPVRAPDRRVHVMLPMCTNVRAVLTAALCPTNGLGNAALECGLTRAARLVELSAMVVLPGATDQDAHTDVPPHTVQRMATLWVALQDVDRTLGPTMVYASNPSHLATRFDWASLQRGASAQGHGKVSEMPALVGLIITFVCAATRASKLLMQPPLRVLQNENTMTTYNPEGLPEEIPLDLYGSPCAAANQGKDGSSLPQSVEDLGLGKPVAVEMKVGDAMLMDVRTFHYGSANTSSDCDGDAVYRVQLSATFEEPLPQDTPCATAGGAPVADDQGSLICLRSQGSSMSRPAPKTGFTYELRDDLHGKFVLGDFLPNAPSYT